MIIIEVRLILFVCQGGIVTSLLWLFVAEKSAENIFDMFENFK
jgi:hypothetical protein